jgi:hypothetical protein
VVAKEGIEPPTLSGLSFGSLYSIEVSLKSLRESNSGVEKV